MGAVQAHSKRKLLLQKENNRLHRKEGRKEGRKEDNSKNNNREATVLTVSALCFGSPQ